MLVEPNLKTINKYVAGKQSILEKVRKLLSEQAVDFFACPICGFGGRQLVTNLERYGLPLEFMVCDDCGHIYQPKPLSEQGLAAFYTQYYRALYEPNDDPAALFFDQQGRGRKIRDFVMPCMRPGGRVLEVGAGAGGIIATFHDAGFETLAVDYDDRYLAQARQHGVTTQNLNDGPLSSDQKFDLIIFSHIIEHTFDPIDSLRHYSENLRPGGQIYVEVPSIHCVRSRYEGDLTRFLHVAHIHSFSGASFQKMAVLAGLRPVKVDLFIRALLTPGVAQEKNALDTARSSQEELAAIRDAGPLQRLFSAEPRIFVSNTLSKIPGGQFIRKAVRSVLS